VREENIPEVNGREEEEEVREEEEDVREEMIGEVDGNEKDEKDEVIEMVKEKEEVREERRQEDDGKKRRGDRKSCDQRGWERRGGCENGAKVG